VSRKQIPSAPVLAQHHHRLLEAPLNRRQLPLDSQQRWVNGPIRLVHRPLASHLSPLQDSANLRRCRRHSDNRHHHSRRLHHSDKLHKRQRQPLASRPSLLRLLDKHLPLGHSQAHSERRHSASLHSLRTHSPAASVKLVN
jgi:hypothetical protein